MNRERPHVLVLPEDQADSDIAKSFNQEIDSTRMRQMRVLPFSGGREIVLEDFKSVHSLEMDRYPKRFMILLIDFDYKADYKEDRLQKAQSVVPNHLIDRVFILGAKKDPEALNRAALGSFEEIGSKLARNCREDTYDAWGHDMLKHNASELARLREHVRPILFDLT